MYQINWKSLETGKTGHGQPVFKRLEMAQYTVNQLNKELPFLYHWVTGPHTDQQPPSFQQLTTQEAQIIELVSEGKSNQEISDTMKLSPRVVKNYLSIIFQKLQVNNRTEAAIEWQQRQK